MIARAKNDFYQEKVVLTFDNASVATDETHKVWKVPAGRTFRLDKVMHINPTGLVQDASNYFNVKVMNGATVMANWSTQTGAQGTLTANTFVNLVLSATDLNRVAAASAELAIFFDETGASTFPAGRTILEGRIL